MDKEIMEELRRLGGILAGNAKSMLTTEEAAEYIGCAPSTLREMARKRAIAHYKDPQGRMIRFKREDLDAWMMHLRIDTQQEVDDAAARYVVGYKRGRA